VLNEERIEGWENISKAFPCAHATFINKHAPRMLQAGYAFKSHVERRGIRRCPVVWTFKPLILAYLSATQIRDKKV